MTQELFTFQVMAGEHQGTRQKYVKGDIFQSIYELDKMFVGKFQRIPNSQAPVEDAQRVVVSNEEQANVPAALRTRKIHKPTGIVKEPLPFSFAEAVDVTHLFTEAHDTGLSVYKDALGSYAIAEASAVEKKNLAGQVLGSRAQVRVFLKDFQPRDLPE